MQINNSNFGFTRYQGNKQLSVQDKKQLKSSNEIIKDAVDKAFDYTEEEESRLNESISYKLKTGAKLTPAEMRYIQKKNPVLYMKLLMMEKKKEMLKSRLKNCKSKKEVNDVINKEVSLIKKDDPDRDMKLKAIQEAEKEFKKTADYKRLPDMEKRKEKASSSNP